MCDVARSSRTIQLFGLWLEVLDEDNFKLKLSSFLPLFLLSQLSFALPPGFVYLNEIDPSIMQDIRYAGYHNFVGRPVQGYHHAACVLTTQAAANLMKVQHALRPLGLTLKVYDCYRPTDAVADFYSWSQNQSDQKMQAEFYPRVAKADVFKLGYVAMRSGHSRGSTVDLTIVALKHAHQAPYQQNNRLIACFAPQNKRYHDNSIDMGTGYDCLDETAHVFAKGVNKLAASNRMTLRQVMIKYGFVPYENEWWHFTLAREPYPDAYFNFKA